MIAPSILRFLLLFLPISFDALADPVPDPVALRQAIRAGDVQAAEKFLKSGLDPNQSLPGALPPMLEAVRAGRKGIVELLLTKGGDPNIREEGGSTALVQAIYDDRRDIAFLLLQKGANPFLGSGIAPLMLAVRYDDAEMAKAILAKLGSRKLGQANELVAAADDGNFDMVQLLLDAGAEIESTDGQMRTALHAATEHNHARLVKLLLEKGANLKAECIVNEETGATGPALVPAAKTGAEAAARVLVEAGLDPNSNEGAAIRLADDNGFPTLAEYLRNPKASSKPSLLKESLLPQTAMPGEATRMRIAILDFEADDFSTKSWNQAVNFSTLLQAGIGSHPTIDWVERSEIARAEQELALGAAMDSSQKVALGKWLKADILVTGNFSLDQGAGSLLTLQAIDLHRGELLAESKILIQTPDNLRFSFSPADLKRASEQLGALLCTAAVQQLKVSRQILVAPLFFRNVSPLAGRLDFVESDLKQALAEQKNTQIRILRFPGVDEASEEGLLSLTGLTEAEPTAWKNVTDYYIWGEFSELNASGIPFPEVDVEFKLNVWDGEKPASTFAFQCKVKDLATTLREQSNKLIQGLALKKSAADDAARVETAKNLLQRALELAAMETHDRRSVPAIQRWKNRIALLQLAKFLEPADATIDRELMIERFDQQLAFPQGKKVTGLRNLLTAKQRDEAWRRHVERFGLASLNQKSTAKSRIFQIPGVPGSNTQAQENYYIYSPIELASMLSGNRGDTEVPNETPRGESFRQINAEYKEADRRLTKVLAEAPQNFAVPLYLFNLEKCRDPATTISLGSKLWKVSSNVRQTNSDAWIKLKNWLTDDYELAGRSSEAGALFASNEDGQSKVIPIAGPARASNADDEPKPEHDLPSHGSSRLVSQSISLVGEAAIKNGLDQLCYYKGLVWIGTNAIESGNSVMFWTYDPVTKRSQRLSGVSFSGPDNVGSMFIAQDKLWIAGNGFGISNYDIPTKKLTRYSDRDGIPGENFLAGVDAGPFLIFSGGIYEKPGYLALFDQGSKKWSNQSRSEKPLDRVVEMAFASNKVLVVEEGPAHKLSFSFFEPGKGIWTPLTDQIAQKLTPALSANTFIAKQVICAADASGYYIAGGKTLLHLNAADQKIAELPASVPILGVITAIHNDGEYLWIATAEARRESVYRAITAPALVLLKKGGKFTRYELSQNGTINAMETSDKQLWLSIKSNGTKDYLLEADKPRLISELR